MLSRFADDILGVPDITMLTLTPYLVAVVASYILDPVLGVGGLLLGYVVALFMNARCFKPKGSAEGDKKADETRTSDSTPS